MLFERIKMICKKKGIKQKQMLEDLSLNPNFMHQSKNPNIGNIIKIADYLDVSIDYLVGRSDDPKCHKRKENRQNTITKANMQKNTPINKLTPKESKKPLSIDSLKLFNTKERS